jgi:hypothetical protein
MSSIFASNLYPENKKEFRYSSKGHCPPENVVLCGYFLLGFFHSEQKLSNIDDNR